MKDGKLKSKDFFDVENNPLITFHSTKVEQTDEALLRCAVLTIGAGTREELRAGIEVGVLRKTIAKIKTVAQKELFAVGSRIHCFEGNSWR
jgi:polyisoprenoid-binding protein YceI